MLIPAFQLHLNNSILTGLADVGKCMAAEKRTRRAGREGGGDQAKSRAALLRCGPGGLRDPCASLTLR